MVNENVLILFIPGRLKSEMKQKFCFRNKTLKLDVIAVGTISLCRI